MDPLYVLDSVTKCYGDRSVLSVDALAIDDGEALALVGPSGAGKSTLLRLLCLLETPTAGTLRYAGQAITGRIPLEVQRDITLVFQRPLLLDTTVERNVAYGLRLRGQRDDRTVAEVMERLGLARLARERAGTLSGGEIQRVALARALVVRPRVLLLDEPTANLDPQNVATIEAALEALRREEGTTVVLATHNLHQARRLTERAAMLLDGELVEVGPTDLLLTGQAIDSRTRAFLTGEMVY